MSRRMSFPTEVDSKPVTILKDEYKMVKKLGSGGFASVFLVSNQSDGRFYAAKYQKVRDNDEKWCARTEVALIKRMEQSHFIINMKDFFEGPSESVIVTEYAKGSDLFEAISDKTFSLTEAKCRVISGQVLEALEFLHKNRVIHLDIKHNNIVFASTDPYSLKIKLIDFGLARELGGMDKVKCNMVGTLEFMAPEIMNCTFASPLSDMWSMGVLLFMMVSGGLSPFWSGSDYGTQRKVVRADFNFDNSVFGPVSSQAKDLISRLLVLTPSKRLTAKAALNHPWLTPDAETIELSKQTSLETSLMRKFLARRRWRMLKIAMQAIKTMKTGENNNQELACGIFPVDNIPLYHVKKAKLKKCFRRKSIPRNK